jgi:hypothetical protein
MRQLTRPNHVTFLVLSFMLSSMELTMIARHTVAQPLQNTLQQNQHIAPPPTNLPDYCAVDRYRDFFGHFVRRQDDQNREVRHTYTWEQIEIRNYEQTEQLLAVASKESYKAFRLALDHDWIYIDRRNTSFYETPPIRISRRKPGDQPVYYPRPENLKFSDGPPLVTRLKAREFAKLDFRNIADRSFQVDYVDAHYARSGDASSSTTWIETGGESGAYIFEHRNGCWYLTQDLRMSKL